MTMPFPARIARLAVAFAFLAKPAAAEYLFVGIMETDSYQSAIYGASAFSRIADLPLALDLVNDTLTKNLLTPSLAGIATQERLRVVRAIDVSRPVSDDNPANIAIIPLADRGETLRGAYEAAYASRSSAGMTTLFESPADTNHPPRVALAVAGRHMLTSTSREALSWAWENRSKLIDAPPQNIPGTFRVLVNPQRFADLVGSRNQALSPLLDTGKLLRDFESLSFSLTLEGQAVSLTLRGTPKKDSQLDAFARSVRKPSDNLWHGIPEKAFYASLAANSQPDTWTPYRGSARLNLLHPVGGLAPDSAFTGDRLYYMAPNRDRKGFCLVQIEPVTNAAPVRDAIKRFHSAEKDDLFALSPQPPRRVGDITIETYGISPQPAVRTQGTPAEAPSVVMTILTLFLKNAVLETAVTDGHLITVIGPPGSIDEEFATLRFQEKMLTLSRKVGVQHTSLAGDMTCAASMRLAAFLRHVVSIMPGIKPEQLRVLPLSGDGATFGIALTDEPVINVSLRIEANEVAALQRINKEGRELLQEVFFQMFAKQMMEMQQAPVKQQEAP